MADREKTAPAEVAEADLDAAQGGALAGSVQAVTQKGREPSGHSGGANVVLGDGSVRF